MSRRIIATRSPGLLGVLLLLLVYWLTLLPGVGYTGDTAKFQFVGKVLGTPHATGYPLYILINHVFVTILPIGSTAFRANLLSAVCAALACGYVYRILRRQGVEMWPALATMMALGLSPTAWSQAVVAEVYSLNAFFVAAVLYHLLAWRQDREPRELRTAILLFALSLGNHMTMVLLLPALAFFVLRTDIGVVRYAGNRWCLAGAVILGVGQYGYLIWRYHDPGTVFMETCVPGPRELWHVITGAQFKPRMFSFSLPQVLSVRVPLVAGQLWRELGPLLVAAAVGVVAMRPRIWPAALSAALMGNLIFTLNYDIPDINVYIIPAVLVIVLMAGSGLQTMLSRLGGRLRRAVGPCLLVIPAMILLSGHEAASQKNNTADARRIEAMLDFVGRDALLVGFEYNDFCYLSYYLIGERMQWSRGIYMPRYYNHDEYVEYFRSGIPITMVDQRINTPTGLRVYVKDGPIADQFRQDGLVLTPVEFGLCRVSY